LKLNRIERNPVEAKENSESKSSKKQIAILAKIVRQRFPLTNTGCKIVMA